MAETHGERPSIWAGHVVVSTGDPARAAGFYESLGMRPVVTMDDFAVLEMRGGTHLVVRKDMNPRPGPVDFDLMVDDIATTHAAWDAAGLRVSAIERGSIHETFTVTDPDGHTIVVNSTHVVGPV
jgi:catechol 2,3-dioxygenase-like lactoylglutathione lyase family enzyme